MISSRESCVGSCQRFSPAVLLPLTESHLFCKRLTESLQFVFMFGFVFAATNWEPSLLQNIQFLFVFAATNCEPFILQKLVFVFLFVLAATDWNPSLLQNIVFVFVFAATNCEPSLLQKLEREPPFCIGLSFVFVFAATNSEPSLLQRIGNAEPAFCESASLSCILFWLGHRRVVG